MRWQRLTRKSLDHYFAVKRIGRPLNKRMRLYRAFRFGMKFHGRTIPWPKSNPVKIELEQIHRFPRRSFHNDSYYAEPWEMTRIERAQHFRRRYHGRDRTEGR